MNDNAIVKRAGDNVERNHMHQLYYKKMPAALRNALGMGLLVGGGGAALAELVNYLVPDADDLKKLKRIQNVDRPYDFPVFKSSSAKQAGISDYISNHLGKYMGKLNKGVNAGLGALSESADTILQKFPGVIDYHGILPSNASQLRAFIPLMVGGTGLGAYAGYKGVSALTKYLREKRDEEEVREARDKFEDAMKAEYSAAHQLKQSMEIVDDLYDDPDEGQPAGQCKEAKVGDYINTALGMQASAGLLIWYLMHRATRKYLKKTEPAEVAKNLWINQRIMEAGKQRPSVTFTPEGQYNSDPATAARELAVHDLAKRDKDEDAKGAFTPSPF